MNRVLHAFLIIIALVSVPGCQQFVYQDTRATAVALPDQLADQSLKGLQAKHYDALVSISRSSPFPMKVGSIGFVKQKGNTYIAINLVGETYNSITTTTATRLSNEFREKYKTMAGMFLSKGLEADSYGLRLLLGVAHYNFVSQESFLAQPENLELYTPWPIVAAFVSGDITDQELVSKSMVFMNAQRTAFILQYL